MENLAKTVTSLKPFVPAKIFDLSRQFYLDLGFTIVHEDKNAIGFYVGKFGFLLQNFYNQELADNLMVHLLVTDVDAWWKHIQTLPLTEKYGIGSPKPPRDEPWSLRVLYLQDPSGVLWHIAQPI